MGRKDKTDSHCNSSLANYSNISYDSIQNSTFHKCMWQYIFENMLPNLKYINISLEFWCPKDRKPAQIILSKKGTFLGQVIGKV